MASLSPEEHEYAINLDYEKLPNRLRCAVCNKAVIDAMKTECCDTVMCGACAAKLTGTCPVCEYAGSPEEMTREDKRTRTTLKAHIKGELQKRNNAAAAAAKEAEARAEAEKAAEQETATSAAAAFEQPVEPAIEEPAVTEAEPAQDSTDLETREPADEVADEDDDFNDDKSDIEIITERPEAEQQQYDEEQVHGEEDEHYEQGDGNEQQQEQQQQQFNQNGQPNMPFDPQAFMNFAAMNGFNPMMPMQPNMMAPFAMMSNMMGMPNMNMDPSMMFGGGFGGMNGMMNGNMMMPMGDMNGFNPYDSQQYGNRFDNRSSHHSNRGSGRGFGGQDFRGRGRGFGRGGRGRGGWQQYNGQQDYNQQGYQQDYDSNAATEAVAERDDGRYEENESSAVQDPTPQAVDAPADVQTEHHQVRQHDHDQYESSDRFNERRASQVTVQAAPPINAPKGPRAMREGLPNSGRYSRPQALVNDARPASREQSAPFNPPTGPSAQRREREHDDRSSHRRRDSRSRSPVGKDKRDRSRSPRRDDKYDREDKHKRRDRKRSRDYDDDRDYESKKRSRSGTPDDSHRRHRHRDDKERSRRDRSRDKHRDRHRSRERESDKDERRRSKSYKSRRDREDKYGDDFEKAGSPPRQPRAVLVAPQDDIGFKIKGKSANNAPADTAPASTRSDPYAEEREKMREQRLQRDAERRQTTNGKRGRDDGYADEHDAHKKKKKSKSKYESEDSHDRHRWR